MIAGLLAAAGGSRVLRVGLAVAAVLLLLLLACRRSGERLGRVLERLERPKALVLGQSHRRR